MWIFLFDPRQLPEMAVQNSFEKYRNFFEFQVKRSFFMEEILFCPLDDILLWVKTWVRMVSLYFSLCVG